MSKTKLEGSTGHEVTGSRPKVSANGWVGRPDQEQNEVLVPFILAITMVGQGKGRRREAVFKSIGRHKQNKRSRQT